MDAESVLMQMLSPFGWTVTSTPPNLAERLTSGPVIRVARAGGGATEDIDSPRVTVQPFVLASAAEPRAAQRVALDIRALLLATNGVWVTGELVPDGALVERVGCESGPIEYPYADPTIRVTQSIYTLTIRL